MFWKTKSLSEMTLAEWESLCDGCGKCCLEKLEDEETGEILYTSVACPHLDIWACRCRCYADRHQDVPDCLVIIPNKVKDFNWLPKTCAYRLVAEGKPLASWHPLLSEDPETVHEAGISVRDKVISGRYVDMLQLEAYVLDTII